MPYYLGVDKRIISAWMARLARRKAAAMTREQRAEMARKMNKARWDKVRKAQEQPK